MTVPRRQAAIEMLWCLLVIAGCLLLPVAAAFFIP